MTSGNHRFNRTIRGIHHMENAVLCLLLSVMIGLSFAQISGRLFFKIGFSWADPIIYHLILWVSLVGAGVATREKDHINIDIISRLLKPKQQRFVLIVTNLFSSGVCGTLTWAAWRFVREEALIGTTLLGTIPVWFFQIILPFSFGVIAFRFFLHAVNDVLTVIEPEKDS
jgi:C4-dicarboxylate transporter, DctQ subunit